MASYSPPDIVAVQTARALDERCLRERSLRPLGGLVDRSERFRKHEWGGASGLGDHHRYIGGTAQRDVRHANRRLVPAFDDAQKVLRSRFCELQP